VSCSATVSGVVTAWAWDFGDANDPSGSTAPIGVHTFDLPGEYIVSLTVSGPGGENQQTTTVSVQ
jgi:PKD repeat protein